MPPKSLLSFISSISCKKQKKILAVEQSCRTGFSQVNGTTSGHSRSLQANAQQYEVQWFVFQCQYRTETWKLRVLWLSFSSSDAASFFKILFFKFFLILPFQNSDIWETRGALHPASVQSLARASSPGSERERETTGRNTSSGVIASDLFIISVYLFCCLFPLRPRAAGAWKPDQQDVIPFPDDC